MLEGGISLDSLQIPRHWSKISMRRNEVKMWRMNSCPREGWYQSCRLCYFGLMVWKIAWGASNPPPSTPIYLGSIFPVFFCSTCYNTEDKGYWSRRSFFGIIFAQQRAGDGIFTKTRILCSLQRALIAKGGCIWIMDLIVFMFHVPHLSDVACPAEFILVACYCCIWFGGLPNSL